MTELDEIFFIKFPQRQYRIRDPFGNESEKEFETLGPHERSRRKIIAWHVPQKIKAPYTPWAGKVLKVPFLTVFDEEIANEDAVLAPIWAELMMDAAAEHGLAPPGMQ